MEDDKEVKKVWEKVKELLPKLEKGGVSIEVTRCTAKRGACNGVVVYLHSREVEPVFWNTCGCEPQF